MGAMVARRTLIVVSAGKLRVASVGGVAESLSALSGLSLWNSRKEDSVMDAFSARICRREERVVVRGREREMAEQTC